MNRTLLSLCLSFLLFSSIGCDGDAAAPKTADAAVDATSHDGDASTGDDASVPDDASVNDDASVPDDAATGDAGTTKSCVGTRPSCASLAGAACTTAGCTTEQNGTCEGTAADCTTYDGNFGRCFAAGCNYDGVGAKCTGTPTQCASVNLNACGTTNGPSGCAPQNACSGTLSECSTYTTQGACIVQTGCSWQ